MNADSIQLDNLFEQVLGESGTLIQFENDTTINRKDAPLKSIRPSTIETLATLLNPIKIIPTEGGLLRDWRGLAELSGISTEQISFLDSRENPTKELMKLWVKDEIRSISDLKAYLGLIDRFDICDDLSSLLENDVASYWSLKEMDPAVSIPDQEDFLTIGDTDLTHLSRYDAFLLYAEEDSEFAMQIVDKMENEYNLKICLKDRDLLGGAMFEHETIGRIIEERCNRLVAIFSPSFLKSPANQFLVSFAQALALERRQRKIIPCMYVRCDLPPSVRYSFCLDYSRSGKLWNFWEKLGQSIRTTASSAIDVPKSQQLSRLHAQATSLPSITLYDSQFLPQSLDKPNSKTVSTPDANNDWWIANKTRPHSSYSTSDSGVLDDFDTRSLSSASPLVTSPLSFKSPGSKFQSFKKLKKFITSSKKKAQREQEPDMKNAQAM